MKTSEMITKQFATLDHMPVGAFVLRKNFVVVFWNSRLEDWTGITRDKIVGEPIEMYFPHLRATKYFVRIQDVFNTGMPFIFSSYLHKYLIPVILPNNQIQIQSTTVTRVPDLNGRNYYVIFSIQDVTELTHRIEQALAQAPDYVSFGPVFVTGSKQRPDPVVGLDGLESAARAAKTVGCPLVAIGGIDLRRAPAVAALGAMGAVIGALLPADGGLERVTELAQALHSALSPT